MHYKEPNEQEPNELESLNTSDLSIESNSKRAHDNANKETLKNNIKTKNYVNLDLDAPFEAKAKEYIKGAYYVSAEEALDGHNPIKDISHNSESELNNDKSNNFSSKLTNKFKKGSFDLNRRDFLKLFSISALVSSVSSCVQRPVEKIVPYVKQPMDTVPGRAKYYGTTCKECPSTCGVMVKTKDGRPIKLEGLEKHPVNTGSLCAIGQASIQGLYHPERLKHAKIKSSGRMIDITDYKDAVQRLAELYKDIKKSNNNKQIAILTHGMSGSSVNFYQDFLTKLGSKKDNLYRIEPKHGWYSISKAHKLYFNQSGIARLQLANANFIVGFSADFLDTGISPVFSARGFSASHSYTENIDQKDELSKITAKKGYFVQFESVLSLTGSKADKRFTVPVESELALMLLLLKQIITNSSFNALSKATNTEKELARQIVKDNHIILDDLSQKVTANKFKEIASFIQKKVVTRLFSDKSVVVAGDSSGVNKYSTQMQLISILINRLIGSYQNNILDFDQGWVNEVVGEDDLNRFMQNSQNIGLLLIIDYDPVQSLAQSTGIKKTISSIDKVVSMQIYPKMVDKSADLILPISHYLESWGDSEPFAGYVSIQQPAVRPLYNTAQAEDVLLNLCAFIDKPMGFSNYRSYLFNAWKKDFISKKLNLTSTKAAFDQENEKLFSFYLKKSLKIGSFSGLKKRSVSIDTKHLKNLLASSISFERNYTQNLIQSFNFPGKNLKFISPIDYRLLDGRYAHIPILQEIGNSLSTVAWDSYVAINPYTCRKLGIKRNDLVTISANHEGTKSKSLQLAVYPMPGLDHDVILVYQGGGIKDDRNTIANNIGINPLDIWPNLQDPLTKQNITANLSVTVTPTGKKYKLAAMQKHNDIANRSDVYKKVSMDHLEYSKQKRLKSKKTKNLDDVPDLYPSLDKPEIYMHKQQNKQKASINYRWGMSIDLDRCNGCGACMVACSLENNVPQVGKNQIMLGREMFWIRLDRYFDSSVDEPGVSFQPVMCQQCNHAPCEAVCPVFATTHDPEGINAMTYNRCVGTRYCANACPYKVRRFNWWTHKFSDFGKYLHNRTPRALNPDVTVRTRGVMEKCNFCVGRITEKKHEAKLKSKQLGIKFIRAQGIKTACEQTCPASAITFGNLKEPGSKASRLRSDERAYLMLGGDPDHKHYGIKTLPNVSYLAEVVEDKEHLPYEYKPKH